MFERLSNSFTMAKCSWNVLMADKQLLVFPFLSGLACLFILASFAVPVAVFPEVLQTVRQEHGQVHPLAYVALFIFYFVNYFVVVFFNSALVSCALARLNGQEASVSDGLQAACKCLPQILAWAAVSATVGVLLRAIENAWKNGGEFVSRLLGLGWTVMTYFVVPVLVVERVGPFEAIQRSMQILKKTWGEALIGHYGLGLFNFVLMLPCILILVLGFVLLFQPGLVLVGAAVLALAFLYGIVFTAVSAAMAGIYLTALYQFASTGDVPSGFEDGDFAHAFTCKA